MNLLYKRCTPALRLIPHKTPLRRVAYAESAAIHVCCVHSTYWSALKKIRVSLEELSASFGDKEYNWNMVSSWVLRYDFLLHSRNVFIFKNKECGYSWSCSRKNDARAFRITRVMNDNSSPTLILMSSVCPISLPVCFHTCNIFSHTPSPYSLAPLLHIPFEVEEATAIAEQNYPYDRSIPNSAATYFLSCCRSQTSTNISSIWIAWAFLPAS